MDTKQIFNPFVVGFISTACCFSFGFFTSICKYNMFDFFCTYVIFLIIICHPMNLVAACFEKKHPSIFTHGQLIKKFISSSKMRFVSILFISCIMILISLILLNISTYVLSFFNNVQSINKLSHASSRLNINLPTLISLGAIFAAISLLFILAIKNKVNFNNLLKTLTYLCLCLVATLIFIAAWTSFSSINIEIFNSKNQQTTTNIRSMLAMALIHAILSNCISLAIYKNLIGVAIAHGGLKITSFKIIFYNIIFSLIICVTIYAILGSNIIFLQTSDEIQLSTIFNIIKNSSLACYFLLEAIFIIFNLIILTAILKYILKISDKIYIRLMIITVPLLINIGFIDQGITYINFSELLIFHFIIIFIFLFEVFIVGWVYDAQKFSYEVLKNTNTKLSPIFNITLRIVIPLICLYVFAGHIFSFISTMWQILITAICIIIYIATGTIFNKIFNKRKF